MTIKVVIEAWPITERIDDLHDFHILWRCSHGRTHIAMGARRIAGLGSEVDKSTAGLLAESVITVVATRFPVF
ncbi:MAG: hypothetical protein H7X91_01165 [Burkholderiales bacterium]|nr:hypothetical protein [Burkholderiales bacterium]